MKPTRTRIRTFCLPLAAALLAAPWALPAAQAAPGDPIVVDKQVDNFQSGLARVSGASVTRLTGGTAGALTSAVGMAFVDADTAIAVGFQAIYRVDVGQTLATTVVTRLRSGAAVGDLQSVVRAPDGSVLATDLGLTGPQADGRILRIDPADGSFTVVSSGGLVAPFGIARAEDGTLYVSDTDAAVQGSIVKIAPGGAQSTLTSGAFRTPRGVDFLPSGELVVVDDQYNRNFRGALVRVDPATGAQTPLFLAGPGIDNATGVAVVPNAGATVLVAEREIRKVDRVNLDTGAAANVTAGLASPSDLEPEPGIAPTTSIVSGPSGITNDSTPTFAFAPSQYGAQSSCSLDGVRFTPCTRSFTPATPLADGTYTFSVRSTVLGFAGVTATRTFSVQAGAADTIITDQPPAFTNDTTPSFSFAAPGGGSSFACAIPAALILVNACTSPFTVPFPGLADGPYTFTVRASGDATGASYDFTVDTRAPETTVQTGIPDGNATNNPRPPFSFGTTEPAGASFACTLNAVTVPCDFTFTPAADLPEGLYTLTAAASDRAGNVDPTPVSRTFTVDLRDPTITSLVGPATQRDATPEFTFAADERANFTCAVDDVARLRDCNSPFEVTPPLADGSYTFFVQATDAAGNRSAIRQLPFTIDSVVPDTSIVGPPAFTNDSTPEFAFASTKPQSTFQCAFEQDELVNCPATFTAPQLADGEHTLTVVATDRGGNVDPTPATHTFTVDTVAPQTRVTGGPSGPTNDPTPAFSFDAGDEPAPVTFACRLNGQALATCRSGDELATLADDDYTLTVTATDAAGNVEAVPATRSFRVDTDAPETSIPNGPPSPTNDPTPRFGFSSDEVVTYACAFETDAAPAPCATPFLAPPLADGEHTLTVTATDEAGNSDPTPATRTFAVDTTAPDVRITDGPQGATRERSPEFVFDAGGEQGVSFSCRVGDATVADCHSPFTPADLADGDYTFAVTARDAAGNVAAPVTRSFTVDTVAPDTNISGGPSGVTKDATPEFTLRANVTERTAVTFLCGLDGAEPTPCPTPFTTPSLADGPHTLSVGSVDAAGNVDDTPATRDFAVDTLAPRATIDTPPAALSNDATPPIAFHVAEAGATTQCRVDDGPAVPCASPFTAAPVGHGSHRLAVIASDAIGNADQDPPAAQFTVDLVAPQTRIDAGPPSLSADLLPAFAFGADEAATFACTLDGGQPVACDGRFVPAAALALGDHRFSVVATDRVGNVDQTPAALGFRLVAPQDLPRPAPPRGGTPPGPVKGPAHLSVRRTIRRGVLRVSARVARGAAGRVVVTVTGRRGRRGFTRRVTIRLKAGRAAARVKLPAGAKRVRVRAAYRGDATHKPATVRA